MYKRQVVEMAPAFALPLETRKAVCDAAVKIMKNVGYVNAGTCLLYTSNNLLIVLRL